MDNRKTAIIVTVFAAVLIAVAALLGISEHIPIFGKAIALVIAVLLIVIVLVFFILAAGRGRK